MNNLEKINQIEQGQSSYLNMEGVEDLYQHLLDLGLRINKSEGVNDWKGNFVGFRYYLENGVVVSPSGLATRQHTPVEQLSDKQIEQCIQKALKYAKVWEDCTDGSYEYALNVMRYYELHKELEKRNEG